MPQLQQANSLSQTSSRGSSHRAAESSAMAGEIPPTVVSRHNIHSRTKSPSHGLTKRDRSCSRGRKQQSRPSTTTKKLPRESSFGNSNASSRFSGETSASQGSSNFRRNHYESVVKTKHGGPIINELGRCARHPQMELCCRDSATSPWKVLLQECPLCSLDLSKLHHPSRGDKVILDGASSSQPSTSTTNRTSTEEDESSVKSWTMSDVSSVDKESKCNNSGAPSSSSTPGSEPLLNRRTPPPPPRGAPTKHIDTNLGYSSLESSFSYNKKTVSNPIQLLKELGRKLVIESESPAGGGAEGSASSDYVQLPIEALPNRPPPPPFVRRSQNPLPTVHSSENNATRLSQTRKQQQPGSNMRTSSRRASPAASGGLDGSNDSILFEAADIIARMESLMQGESTKSNKSRTKSSRSKQQTDIIGGGDSVEKKAAEKLARIQRRKERALKNAEKLKAREPQRQHQEYDGVRLEAVQPMIDPASSTTRRGRDGPHASDILLEAAQVRDRARRSASRSRERLKAAAIFCGETPLEEDDEFGDNRELLATERRRSILNPHGLEDQPIPPNIERRSQSRERKWSGSDRRITVEAGGIVHDSNEDVVTEAERRHGSRGRNRAASLSRTPNQQSAVEDLLTRRRDIRQKIVEMKSSAQSRTDNRRTLGAERTEECYPSNDEEMWARSTGDIESATRGRPSERRRGRSRSAVRVGYSRIRSSSLNVFRKKGVKEIDSEDEVRTVDSGRFSMASLKHVITQCRPRSLSVRRRRRNNQSDATGSWLTDSENSTVDDRRGSFGMTNDEFDFDTRSADKLEIGTTKSSSSTSGVFHKFLKKKKSPINSGHVRSLSQEGKRNSIENERWDSMSEGVGSRVW